MWWIKYFGRRLKFGSFKLLSMRFVNAVFTTDHKLIGQLYLVLGGFSAIIGTIYSV